MTPVPAGATLLRASRLLDAGTTITDAWVLFRGDTIVAVGGGADAPTADRVINLGARTLVPGFIDLHGHGGAHGAYDNGPDEIRAALDLHRRHGTTRAVLSLVANPLPALTRSLDTIRDVMASDPLVLGAHLEGPFLSHHNHGAHEPGYLLEPTQSHVDTLLTAGEGVLRQVTLAPELQGATAAIRRLAQNGVLAAIGHTVADEDIARRAFDAGATILTHAFNAMPGIHHRRPGPIMAAAADERVTLELILDGIHVAPLVAKILFRAAPGRVALITDAMAAAGSPDGTYKLGSLTVAVDAGVARVHGTDTIAGSTLTQDIAMRNAVARAGLGLSAAIAAVTTVPAAALGHQDRLGRLAGGYAADIVALDDDHRVTHVWAAGTAIPGDS